METKKHIGIDVLTAARQRVSYTFDNFEKIYVSFSGGKDSTVMMHLVMDEAIKRNRKVGILLIDLEAQYSATILHADEMFKIYKDYIDQKDSMIFKHEPYFTTEHVHKKLPLIENWCKLFGLKYNGEQPEIVFNKRELQRYRQIWKAEKPIFVIQSNGGMLSSESGLPYRWTRDIPFNIVQNIVERYKEQYTIYQVTRIGSPVVPGVIPVSHEMSSMEFLSILLNSEKRLLIDSSLQHAAAALDLPSTVLWAGTSPKVFGYSIHDNIVAEMPEDQKLPDSYLFDYDFEGQVHEYPYTEDFIFDIDTIVKSLTRQSL